MILVDCHGLPGGRRAARFVGWPQSSDIEDTLLTLLITNAGRGFSGKGKKFSKLDVKRVYFGNWLRDYSQAVDVRFMSRVWAMRL